MLKDYLITRKIGITIVVLLQIIVVLAVVFQAYLPDWLATPELMVHKMCYMLRPEVIGLHIVSDLIIAISYYTIPLAMLTYLRGKVTELKNFFWLAILFITMCGTTHLLSIVVLFKPLHLIAGIAKAGTAAVSIITAIAVWPLLKSAGSIPTSLELTQVQEALVIKMNEDIIVRAQLTNTIKELQEVLEQRDAEIVKNKKLTKQLEYYIDTETDDFSFPSS